MRADRLLSIMLLLQNEGKITTRQLADRLEVSERTVVRDMNVLSGAGIPVYAERGPQGGWRLMETYRTTLTGLKREELLSLLVNSQNKLLQDLGILGADQERARHKLVASSPGSIRDDAALFQELIHIDGSPWHSREESHPFLGVIQEAVWTRRKLRITYNKADGTSVERSLHPLGLIAKGSVWYLAAEDPEAEQPGGPDPMRTFRISRIQDAHLLEESFERPQSFSLAQYWARSTAEFQASLPAYPSIVRITKKRLSRLSRNRYVKVTDLLTCPEDPGQWVTAQITFDTLESACELLLGCGREALVIEPPEFAKAIQTEAEAILERYARQRH